MGKGPLPQNRGTSYQNAYTEARLMSLGRKTAFLLALCIVVGLSTGTLCHALERESVASGIEMYFAALDAFQAGKLDEALLKLRNAVRICEKNEFHKGAFMARLSLAQVYKGMANYDRAMVELRKAGETRAGARDIRGEGLVLLHMARLEADRPTRVSGTQH